MSVSIKPLFSRIPWFWLAWMLACGLLILVWPRARATAEQTWDSSSSMPVWDDSPYASRALIDGETLAWERAKERWPGDGDVQLVAAEHLAPPEALSLAQKRLEAAPNDVFWLTYFTRVAGQTLDTGYGSGPMFNDRWPGKPNYSVSPPKGTPAQWRQLEAVAKRGAALEPNNSFWTWIHARSLVGLKREREIGKVFRDAASKTRFDAHDGEIQAWRSAVTRRAIPYLLPRFELQQSSGIWAFNRSTRDSTMHGIEQVMFARAAGRHDEAISVALAMIHLNGLMRAQSQNWNSSWIGLHNQTLLFNRAQLPAGDPSKRARPVSIRAGFPFSTFTTTTPRVNPQGNLPLYLMQQRRAPLKILAREWDALAPYNRAMLSYSWFDERLKSQIGRLSALERLARLGWALVIPTFVWAPLAALGAWIWRRHASRTLSWLACWLAATLLLGAIGLVDAAWWWQNVDVRSSTNANVVPWVERLGGDAGLLSGAPLTLWVWPWMLLSLLALRAATRSQMPPGQTSLRERMRATFVPADGLTAFDISPWVGAFGSVVAWSVTLGVLGALAWIAAPPSSGQHDAFSQIGWAVVFFVALGSFFFARWAQRSGKRAALGAWFGSQLRLCLALLGVLAGSFVLGHVVTALDYRTFERAHHREMSGQTFGQWRAAKGLK